MPHTAPTRRSTPSRFWLVLIPLVFSSLACIVIDEGEDHGEGEFSSTSPDPEVSLEPPVTDHDSVSPSRPDSEPKGPDEEPDRPGSETFVVRGEVVGGELAVGAPVLAVWQVTSTSPPELFAFGRG